MNARYRVSQKITFGMHSALAQSPVAPCVWKSIFWSFLTKTEPNKALPSHIRGKIWPQSAQFLVMTFFYKYIFLGYSADSQTYIWVSKPKHLMTCTENLVSLSHSWTAAASLPDSRESRSRTKTTLKLRHSIFPDNCFLTSTILSRRGRNRQSIPFLPSSFKPRCSRRMQRSKAGSLPSSISWSMVEASRLLWST